jgi:hypothetical protein
MRCHLPKYGGVLYPTGSNSRLDFAKLREVKELKCAAVKYLGIMGYLGSRVVCHLVVSVS